MSEQKGKVYFVGAGPGDRGLMTVKGRRVLGQAEVVLYDSLVNANILDCCSRDAELMYNLGMVQYHLKNRVESKTSLQRALDLNLSGTQAVEARRILAELK